MKQIIHDVECCKDCIFSDWYYKQSTDFRENIVYWVCEHPNMLQEKVYKEVIIEDENTIPDWCPLPGSKE